MNTSPPTKAAAACVTDCHQYHDHAHQRKRQHGEKDARRKGHIASQEVPHDRGAGEARDTDHSSAVQGHQFVTKIRGDRKPRRLERAEDRTGDHHEQEHRDADRNIQLERELRGRRVGRLHGAGIQGNRNSSHGCSPVTIQREL
jgi:hypothetical protein